jgi:hypothetical protein
MIGSENNMADPVVARMIMALLVLAVARGCQHQLIEDATTTALASGTKPLPLFQHRAHGPAL